MGFRQNLPPLLIGETGVLARPRALGTYASNLPLGTTDLYTCPPGRRAYVYGYLVSHFTAGPEMGFTFRAKVGGQYHRVFWDTTLFPPGIASGEGKLGFVMEAGEAFAITTQSAGFHGVRLKVMEFDASTPLRSPRLTGVTTGFNTLYTVPAGKTSLLMPDGPTGYSGSGPSLCFGNGSAGSRTYSWHIVSPGGSPGDGSLIVGDSVAAEGSLEAAWLPLTLPAGTSVVFETDSSAAGQFVWVSALELSDG